MTWVFILKFQFCHIPSNSSIKTILKYGTRTDLTLLKLTYFHNKSEVCLATKIDRTQKKLFIVLVKKKTYLQRFKTIPTTSFFMQSLSHVEWHDVLALSFAMHAFAQVSTHDLNWGITLDISLCNNLDLISISVSLSAVMSALENCSDPTTTTMHIKKTTVLVFAIF